MATVLDCKLIAQQHLTWVHDQRARLLRPPCLAAVLYTPSQNPGSLQYRDLLLKDAERLGIAGRSVEVRGEAELLDTLERLNQDESVTGIIVFYPVGVITSDEDLMDRVAPGKDIEGLHSLNLGYLIKYKRFLDEDRGLKCVVPATAKAVVKALLHHGVPIAGQRVTIVNNSMRVGKPLGLMLENLGATVVKCYDRTRPADLEDCVRQADLLITAVPDERFQLDPTWVRRGAAVVDVSYQGNLDIDAVREVASYVTVPQNRIGQVTRAMMFVNLIYCAQGMEPAVSA